MSDVRASIFGFDGIELCFTDHISVSSDTFMRDESARYKVLSIVEPDNVVLCLNIPDMVPSVLNERDFANYVSENFDLVLTYKKRLLDVLPNSRFMTTTGSFFDQGSPIFGEKENSISFLMSMKNFTIGHRMRHHVYEAMAGVDRINDFEYFQAMTPPTVSKNGFFSKQKYSIIIENEKTDFYVTEKLIDCFLSKTIPIYWGCPSVSNFFDPQGIIEFDSVDELKRILWNLETDHYDSIINVIEENFLRAARVPSYENALSKEIREYFYDGKIR